MHVTIYGVTYDTAEMRAFATGNPAEPTIYLDRNCRVFVERVEPGKPAAVDWASTTEVKALAGRYGIEELMRAIRG